MNTDEIREFLEMAKKMPRCMVTVFQGQVEALIHERVIFDELAKGKDIKMETAGKYTECSFTENDIKYSYMED